MRENTNALGKETDRELKAGKGGRSIFKEIPVILWGLIGLIVILGIVSPNSVLPAHLLDFTRQAAPLIVAGIGQTIVMMIGGLDLSVAAIMVLANVMAAEMMSGDAEKALPAALVIILVGALIGLVNGLLCAKLKMPSFVVTLGMSILLLGVTLIYSDGAPKGSIPDNFRTLGTGFVGRIPTAFIVWAVIAAVIIVIMKFAPIGRYILSTGVNPIAVYQSGINHVTVQILCYVLCGVFAAVAGLQVSAYIGVGTMELGVDYQMNSIAVALLGGASFAGGKGSIPGTILGALFMVVMLSLIAALNMDVGDQRIVQGVILLAALLINRFREE